MAHLKKVEKGAENEVRQVSNGHAPHLEKWWFHVILVVAHAPGGVAHVKAGHLCIQVDDEEEVPVDDERIPIRQLAFSPAEDLMPRTTRAPRTTLMSDSDDDSDSE